MPINWTVVQGMSSVPDGRLPLYDNPDWAKGFDIVIHNECWANGDLPAAVVQNITRPNVARMFFHCTLHSYRVMSNDGWRELIGMTSRRHTSAHNILLKWADGDPITAGLPPFVTPIDELYVIERYGRTPRRWPPRLARRRGGLRTRGVDPRVPKERMCSAPLWGMATRRSTPTNSRSSSREAFGGR